MKIKKLLIIKPKITEDKDKDGKFVCTHYIYPDRYNAEHANHICYNFSGGDKLEGGHLAEGMVIYEAEESEIKALLKEDGIEEISYDDAGTKGKQWKPEKIDPKTEKSRREFDIKDWINDKKEISKKVL